MNNLSNFNDFISPYSTFGTGLGKKLLSDSIVNQQVHLTASSQEGPGYIIDIGCGSEKLLRKEAEVFHQKFGDIDIELIGVDPFNLSTDKQVSVEDNRIAYRTVPEDGLSFLRGLPDECGSVITTQLDRTIIDDREYVDALVAEIYRIVTEFSEGGFYLESGSEQLRHIAKKLFTRVG